MHEQLVQLVIVVQISTLCPVRECNSNFEADIRVKVISSSPSLLVVVASVALGVSSLWHLAQPL